MTKEQFETITAWQKATFGQATPMSKIAHLAEELEELALGIQTGDPKRDLEYADCLLLLFGAAASDGMSYELICDAIKRKMEINYKRKWGTPNKLGVVNHIKDDPDIKVTEHKPIELKNLKNPE